MPNRLIAFAFLLGASALSACQTPIIDETGPLAIRSVSVSARPTVKSVTDLAPPLQAATTRTLVGVDPAGVPSDVKISIDQVTYKDPLLSLLVGSNNSLTTTVTVTGENGATLTSFVEQTILDAAVNGVIGAAIAIGQERSDVDARLVEAYAERLRTHVYGKPGHVSKKAAAAAPAPAGAPASAPLPATPAPARLDAPPASAGATAPTS